jgi:hypothetical protein
MTPYQTGYQAGLASEQSAIRYEVQADRILTLLDCTRSQRIAILEEAEHEARELRGYTDETKVRAYAACRIADAWCSAVRDRIPQWLAEGRITVVDLVPYLEFLERTEADD